MLSTKLKEAAGNSADATLYVDDVFSTYLYTGNGSTQTITNGIDLAGNGGLVWCKPRSVSGDHYLFDTNRGANKRIVTNDTSAQFTGTTTLSAFNSDGFSLDGSATSTNGNGVSLASWTFRKAAKFFDVVTYTGTGSARTIAHSLGVAPGMVIVKRTDTTGNWQVYHRSLTSAAYSIQLNLINAQASAPTVWNSTAPTSSVFSVGTDATVNASGGTYVAYLFAHDTSSTGFIQCGSVTADGAGRFNVNLGWEAQYVMLKRVDSLGDWYIEDSMRGMSYTRGGYLLADQSDAEAAGVGGLWVPTATGFEMQYPWIAGAQFIYMAIRRPNKPPTSGTQVFSPFVGSDASTITTGFPVDMLFDNKRAGNSNNTVNASRLVGEYSLVTSSTAAETAGLVVANCFQNNTGYLPNALGTGIVSYAFKRAPGFFDVVCYTGTGNFNTSGTVYNVTHNLTVRPEMVIIKRRNGAASWYPAVAISSTQWVNGPTTGFALNTTAEADAPFNFSTLSYGTTTTFRPAVVAGNTGGGYSGTTNDSGATYVAYLFATLAGISKVGSYTGNGTGQAIACGFSAGARFVLIKRTDFTGGWYTFDSARGLTSGSSPYLLLNSNAAEVTGNNGVYASTGGFTLGSTASTTTNITAATYIFLAVA